jgi:exonuclease-1
MLIHFGITPYIVFDGDYLPSKAGTEKDRSARREEARKLGLQLLKLGKTSQAQQELQKAVDVTPEMAALFIEELKRARVQYVVAPYEADSQLAYLERTGHIQGIISEDSDLLVFGARCLLTKLDRYGECVMVRRDDFTACREISLVGWSDRDFRRMAILSGCDYLDSIDGVGLKTAYRLLRRHRTVERVLQSVRLEGKLKVPPDYLAAFIQAEMTFLYQWVFCPTKNGLVNLTDPEPGVEIADMPYLGHFVEPEMACKVATGVVNPHTKQKIILSTNRISVHPHTPLLTKRPAAQENVSVGKNKPLDTFFKPKRVPLAELDPNSFVMTPHQENLARRASSATWDSPLASTPLHDIPAQSRTPAARLQSSHRRSSGGDNMQPPKRQRLCHEDSGDQDAVGSVLQASHSKFFSKPKKICKKELNFDIFSDDAAEEAMLRLSDEVLTPLKNTDQGDSTKPDLEGTNAVSVLESEKDESQITLVNVSEDDLPQKSTDLDPEATFVNEDSVKSGLFEKFALKDVDNTSKQASPTVSGSNSTTLTPSTTVELDASKHRPTALQAHRLDISDYSVAAASAVVVPGSDGVEPSSPRADRVGLHGSEDLLVSDSDEEADASKASPKRRFNVSHFAYSSKVSLGRG